MAKGLIEFIDEHTSLVEGRPRIPPLNLTLMDFVQTYKQTVPRWSAEESRALVAWHAGVIRVMEAKPGWRTAALNRETFASAGNIALGWISAEKVVRGMLLAADYNGLIKDYGQGEIVRIIEKAFNSGIAAPYEHRTSITTNPADAEWPSVFGDTKSN